MALSSAKKPETIVGKRTAGLLMYRLRSPALEVLLVHPGGPYWKKKDAGAWSIPKGICEERENLFDTALREFREETGFESHPPYIALGAVKQPSGTAMTVWAFEGDADPDSLISNSFDMEWPPRSGIQASFPEVDRGGWFEIDEARTRILKGQVRFIAELETGIREDRQTQLGTPAGEWKK